MAGSVLRRSRTLSAFSGTSQTISEPIVQEGRSKSDGAHLAERLALPTSNPLHLFRNGIELSSIVHQSVTQFSRKHHSSPTSRISGCYLCLFLSKFLSVNIPPICQLSIFENFYPSTQSRTEFLTSRSGIF
jgi:hypothetical protein